VSDDELPTMEEALSNVADWGPRPVRPDQPIQGRHADRVLVDEIARLDDAAFDGDAANRGRPPRPRRKPESEIVLEGINHIRSILHGYARKVHGGSMGNAGEPDVDACVRGRACKFEAKAGANKPSRVQLAAMRRWEKAGALVGWFRSNAELQELLDHVAEPDYLTDLSAPGCSQPCHREAA
jgi:hypothetical protein